MSTVIPSLALTLHSLCVLSVTAGCSSLPLGCPPPATVPGLLPVVGVDRGAIPFVLKGAKIMCQGITSKGGKLPDADYDEGEIVAIVAEGKGDLPIAIGQLTMSTKQM